MVQPDAVEVTRTPHRADILGNNDTVIELQKYSIGPADIESRESFYGAMVWLFDATFRFRMIKSGELVFFGLGRNKHIPHCKKPVYLDFGEVVVEVIEFTDFFPGCTGIGRKRDRRWFMEAYLSNVVRPSAPLTIVKSDDETPSNPWETRCPYERMKHPTKWINPADASELPMLKDVTKTALLDRSKEYEEMMFGTPLATRESPKKGPSRSLFE